MGEQTSVIEAEKTAVLELGENHLAGADSFFLTIPVTLSVFNPGPTGLAMCSVDGTSMTAYGAVNPPSCIQNMTATLFDAANHLIGNGVPANPATLGLPPSVNWAFIFTGMPTGVPRPSLKLVVTAANGSQSTTVNVPFSCGPMPAPGNG